MEVDDIDPLDMRKIPPLLGTDGPVMERIIEPVPQLAHPHPSQEFSMLQSSTILFDA
jgi:hypothetical protein